MRQWPEDIVHIANEVLAEIDEQQEVEYRLQSIMAAILAERQRCADVARHLNGWGPVGGHRVAEHIAHTILNP